MDDLPGTLEQRVSGSWRVRVLLGGERVTRHFATEEEAQRFRRGVLALQLRSEAALAGPQTLASYVPKWLEKRDTLPSHKNDASLWRTHLSKASFVTAPLANITRAQVKEWVEKLVRTKARAPNAWKRAEHYTAPLTDRFLSRATVVHALKLLRCVLEAAKEDGHLRENPALEIPLPKMRSTEEEWTFLRFDEMQQILSSSQVTLDEKEMLLFAWHTGLRTGELFGLRKEDVTLDGPHPHLTVRWSWNGPTKTGKVRTVPLLDAAKNAVESYLSRHKRAPSDRVFATVTGVPQQKGYDGGWGTRKGKDGSIEPGIKARAGISRRITFYSATRHTSASHLLMGTWGAAWTLAEVGAFLGHSDAEVTQRYAHVCGVHLAGKAAQTPGLSLSWDTKSSQNCGPGDSNPNAKSRLKTRERATGIEPATFSLGSSHGIEQLRVLRRAQDHSGTTAEESAKRVLLAVAAKGAADPHIEALVLSVLGEERVQLALAVLQAEPKHRARRACELASAVLEAAGVTGKERAGDVATTSGRKLRNA